MQTERDEHSDDESYLRGLLARVTLIGELDLSLDGPVYQSARKVLNKFSSVHKKNFISERNVEQISASFLIVIAALGFNCYKDGGLWIHISPDEGGSSNDDKKLPFFKDGGTDNSKYGKAFQYCLERLEKETFKLEIESEGALPFLGPILFHSGIPIACVNDVWRLLIAEILEGHTDAVELVSSLRQDRERLRTLDKPALRFIVYGGRFAVDLVQRMMNLLIEEWQNLEKIDCIKTSAEFSVPLQMVLQLRELDTQIKTISNVFVPRITMFWDESSGDGPSIELPQVSNCNNQSFWRIVGAVQRANSDVVEAVTLRASRLESQRVFIAPDEKWNVTFDSGQDYQRRRTFIPSAVGSVLAFDFQSGVGVDFRGEIDSLEVVVLHKTDIIFRCSMRGQLVAAKYVQIPSPGGKWNKWQAGKISFEGIDRVQICRSIKDAQDILILEDVRVKGFSARPQIDGKKLNGLTDLDGGEIYVEIPKLQIPVEMDASRLTLRLNFGDGSVVSGIRLTELPIRDGLLDFSDFVLEGCSSFWISLIGTELGMDLRVRIVVLKDAELKIEKKVFPPNVEVTGTLSTTEGNYLLTWPPGKETIFVSVGEAGKQQDFRVTIPRLLHCVRVADGAVNFGSEILTISKESFLNREHSELIVRTQLPENIGLIVEDARGRKLKELYKQLTKNRDFRLIFDLALFIDDILNAETDTVTFFTYLYGERVDLFYVSTAYVARFSKIELSNYRPIDWTANLKIAFTESHSLVSRKLVLNNWRFPWYPDLSFDLDDKTRDVASMALNGLRPGSYLVAIQAGESKVTFSLDDILEIGSSGDYDEYLRSLPGQSACEIAELAQLGNELDISHLSEDALDELVGALSQRLNNCSRNRIANDYASIVASMRLLLKEESQGRPFLKWWFHSCSVKKISGVLSAQEIIIICYPELIDCPLASNFAEEVRGDLWRLSPLLGAAIDPYRKSSESSFYIWKEYLSWTPEQNIPDNVLMRPTPAHMTKYSLEDRQQHIAEICARSNGVRNSIYLTRDGFELAFFQFMVSAHNRDGDVARSARRWLRNNDVSSLLSYDLTLNSKQKFLLESVKPRTLEDSLQNVPHALFKLALIGLTYDSEGRKRERPKLARLQLVEAFVFAPELVVFSLLCALAT